MFEASLRRIVSIVGLALLAVVVAASPAAGYSFERDRVKNDRWVNGAAYCAWKSYPTPGMGCWGEDGDYIQVGDTRSDGLRVGVHWRTNYGRAGICVSTRGHTTTTGTSPVVGHHTCNKNMKEGHKVSLRVGACNADKVNCHRVRNWGMWSAWTRWMTT